MKTFASPIVVRIVGMSVLSGVYERHHDRVLVTVVPVCADGSKLDPILLQFTPPTKDIQKVEGSEDDLEEVAVGGRCHRILRRDGAPYLAPFGLEVFSSLTAFDHVRAALKEDDEQAALEVVGVADGWLLGEPAEDADV